MSLSTLSFAAVSQQINPDPNACGAKVLCSADLLGSSLVQVQLKMEPSQPQQKGKLNEADNELLKAIMAEDDTLLKSLVVQYQTLQHPETKSTLLMKCINRLLNDHQQSEQKVLIDQKYASKLISANTNSQNLDVENIKGETALTMAVKKPWHLFDPDYDGSSHLFDHQILLPIIEDLIKAQVDLNRVVQSKSNQVQGKQGKQGKVALHNALERQTPGIAMILIHAGADVDDWSALNHQWLTQVGTSDRSLDSWLQPSLWIKKERQNILKFNQGGFEQTFQCWIASPFAKAAQAEQKYVKEYFAEAYFWFLYHEYSVEVRTSPEAAKLDAIRKQMDVVYKAGKVLDHDVNDSLQAQILIWKFLDIKAECESKVQKVDMGNYITEVETLLREVETLINNPKSDIINSVKFVKLEIQKWLEKQIAAEAEEKRIADEAEEKRIADEAAEQKRIADAKAEAERIADEAEKAKTMTNLRLHIIAERNAKNDRWQHSNDEKLSSQLVEEIIPLNKYIKELQKEIKAAETMTNLRSHIIAERNAKNGRWQYLNGEKLSSQLEEEKSQLGEEIKTLTKYIKELQKVIKAAEANQEK